MTARRRDAACVLCTSQRTPNDIHYIIFNINTLFNKDEQFFFDEKCLLYNMKKKKH